MLKAFFIVSLLFVSQLVHSSLIEEIDLYSKSFRSDYQKYKDKSDYSPCDSLNKTKQCVVVLNFDPNYLGLDILKTNSSPDINQNIPIQIQAQFGVNASSVFYLDLRFIRDKILKDRNINTEKVLKDFRSDLLSKKKCSEINVFYSGHGEKEAGAWQSYEPSDKYRNEEVAVATLQSLYSQERIEHFKNELEAISAKTSLLHEEITVNNDSKEKKRYDTGFVQVLVDEEKVSLSLDDFIDFNKQVLNKVPSNQLGNDLWGEWIKLPVKMRKEVFDQFQAKYESSLKELDLIVEKDKNLRKELSLLNDRQKIISEEIKKSKFLSEKLSKYYVSRPLRLDLLSTDNSTIVSDSCHSGSLPSQLCQSRENNRNIISSAGASEIAWSDKTYGGFFSDFQARFLSSKGQEKEITCAVDLDGDGELSYNEYNMYLALFRVHYHNPAKSALEMKKIISDQQFSSIPTDLNLQHFGATLTNKCFLKMPSKCPRLVDYCLKKNCRLTEKRLRHIKDHLGEMMTNPKQHFSRYLDNDSGLGKYSNISQGWNEKGGGRINDPETKNFSAGVVKSYKGYLAELLSECNENSAQNCSVTGLNQEVEQLMTDLELVLQYRGIESKPD